MIFKNCDGKIPEPGAFTAEDTAILTATDALYAEARGAMDKQAVTRYLDAVWSVIADANRYFAAEEPWAKKKTDPKRMETILYVAAEIVRQFVSRPPSQRWLTYGIPARAACSSTAS